MRGRGFSLLEMMVATVLAGVILVSLAPLLPQLSRGAVTGRHRMAAVHLAQQQLELTLSQGYAGMSSTSGSIVLDSTIRDVVQSTRYDYEVVVADRPPDLRSVLVTVRWTEAERALSEQVEALVVSP
ncbi:prepilin-type N-terminal cleavage/methylation domain-containing protein [bacterium CPR1]|nr:prepilin-type N-terminal cleavage/methylation domain-containing protein [bacterium CPR1]